MDANDEEPRILNTMNAAGQPIINIPVYIQAPIPQHYGEFQEYYEVVAKGLPAVFDGTPPEILWGDLLSQGKVPNHMKQWGIGLIGSGLSQSYRETPGGALIARFPYEPAAKQFRAAMKPIEAQPILGQVIKFSRQSIMVNTNAPANANG